MECDPKNIAKMMIAQGTLEMAFQKFKQETSRKTGENLSEAIYLYERIVPEEIRQEIIMSGEKDDSAYLARLRLDRYYDACSADK